jgi:hypothetical protein
VVEPPIQHAIMALVIEGFVAYGDSDRASSINELLELVESAASSVPTLRWDYLQVEVRGGGIVLLAAPTFSGVSLAGPFISQLNQRLGERASGLVVPSIRLRAALHLGLADLDNHGWSGPGIDLARGLAEAGELRSVLRAAKRAHIAFAVSDETHESVIRREYRMIDAAAYAPARLDAGPLGSIRGWITVPGYANPPGTEPDQNASGTSASGQAPASGDAPHSIPHDIQNVSAAHRDVIGVQINNAGSGQPRQP